MERQMSVDEKEKIRIGAKKIIDSFASAIDKVKLSKKKESKKVGGFREEGSGKNSDSDFRRIMFENAPEKSSDEIIAEKKQW